jgi:uncharacterized protein
MNYHRLIHKYISPDSEAYPVYITHVTLVTKRALELGRQQGLSRERLRLIEEAAMLHDIGIIKVDAPEIGCHGSPPYICHGTEGRTILEAEGFPAHGLVAERHTGVGIFKEEIITRNMPLPHRDMVPVSLEEKIICLADLFYSKTPSKIWLEKSLDEAYESIATYGEKNIAAFQELKSLLAP